MSDRILRDAEVTQRTGLSRSTRWRKERNGTFPKRRKISSHAVGWLESEIDDFISNPEAWLEQSVSAQAA